MASQIQLRLWLARPRHKRAAPWAVIRNDLGSVEGRHFRHATRGAVRTCGTQKSLRPHKAAAGFSWRWRLRDGVTGHACKQRCRVS
jgi:hypothetical protein